MKKVILRVETNWCGESQEYAAIICDECIDDFYTRANELAYENFCDFGGFEAMMEENFEKENEDDEWSPEQLQEGYELESSYYSYDVEDYDENSHGEWDWYDLVYDCTENN